MVHIYQLCTLFLAALVSISSAAPVQSDHVARSLTPAIDQRSVTDTVQVVSRDNRHTLLFARDDELTIRGVDLEVRVPQGPLSIFKAITRAIKKKHHKKAATTAATTSRSHARRSNMDIESRSDSEFMNLERRISKALHRSNQKAKHGFQKFTKFVKGIAGG
ncbi:hypothetical protein C8J56DRAFT_1167408 [Mycena floridula]|nr:hypothetical protein C8J56DRAFT_1167408 [Mycena floridula]